MGRDDWGDEIPGGYFHEGRHIYRNEPGLIVLSTTQTFDVLGVSDFSNVPEEKVVWKRHYGQALHAATQYLVQGDLNWDTVDDEIIAPVTGIECRLKEMKFELEACEERRVVNLFGMYYGMTLDLRGTIEHQGVRRNAVIDVKTGAKFEAYWRWQLGAYLIPQPKVPLGWMGINLMVDFDGVVTPHYLKDVEAAKREFQCLLAAAILKINNGYAKIGKG